MADPFADVRGDLAADTAIADQREALTSMPPGLLDFLEAGTPSPFPPGQSPHRVRGAAVLGLFALSKAAFGDSGPKKLIARVGDPRVTAFLERRIERGGWEDVYVFFLLARALAETLVMPFALTLVHMARRSARHDVKGPLRFGLKMVSNRTIVSTMQTMGRQYWEFATYVTRLENEHTLCVTSQGVPLILRNVLLLLGAEYNAEVLRLGGSPGAHFRPGEFRALDAVPTARTVGEADYRLIW